ncbi:AarF/ABC1/UbiB kinase family protein [Joostella atrarenae]|uniref:AarF/ABC1/UbiB kinase family protein n=1 Tax=Joostella atrarenae TaxID=679257 RepID=A0ABS9J587_9FLAO|nr:AarF/UbiB family protein [Joostella atrarenae]MCF8715600.1 AarF/ABC1/UbiB kinase family protein [Joostella atrarenae]
MKTLDKIPTGKIQRAGKFLQTGAKVGANYIKYYGDKIVTSEEAARGRLNKNNAEDIYDGLKSLKGSALKVAQMLSMEKSILPRDYVEKFSLAQFSVPPLSPPLVIKTFKKYFGRHPEDIFDTFNATSVNAASIGQVHIAEKNGKKYAIKIQYPGVAESIATDLALVKPIAIKMFNIKGKDSDKYFKEVEHKLIEETNYLLEVKQSKDIAMSCNHIPNLLFPKYYEDLSSERIITMDYMKGKHMSEFTKDNKDEKVANTIGQALWDFYMYQIHKLKKVHADPHPGNFLISDEAKLIALDFGCMKEVPEDFYIPYFELAEKDTINNPKIFEDKLYELEILKPEDTTEEKVFFKALFHEMLSIFTKPFHNEVFDFSDAGFFQSIAQLGEKYNNDSQLRKMNGNRGSKHFIYINRTFFGLYNLMFDLKAKDIKINNFTNY